MGNEPLTREVMKGCKEETENSYAVQWFDVTTNA